MRTMLADQAVAPGLVAIDYQLLAENFDGSDRLFLGQLGGGGHRMPIAAQQLAAGRAAAYLG